MNVLPDTCLWSLALRRNQANVSATEASAVVELHELIKERRVRLIGPIRQEILSGIKIAAQFERIRTVLRSFPDESLQTADYESAGEANNLCRAKGIATTAVDILICTVAISRGWSIFTTDPDFASYRRVLPIQIHLPRK